MVHVRGRSQRQSGEKIRLACVTSYLTNKYLKFAKIFSDSRVAQWKRAGPITQRSEDQNLALLNNFFLFFFQPLSFLFLFIICFFVLRAFLLKFDIKVNIFSLISRTTFQMKTSIVSMKSTRNFMWISIPKWVTLKDTSRSMKITSP